MGTAVGEQFRDLILGVCDRVLERFNKSRSGDPITMSQAEQVVSSALPWARDYAPDTFEELVGTAEAAGVTPERLMMLNARNMLSARRPAGCTSVMAGASATVSGVGLAGQNWDNDPAMDEFSIVLTRRPSGKPSVTTWGQVGLVGYIGFNSEGIGVCMNALNGPSTSEGVPWYFVVRSIYEQSSLDGAAATVGRAKRAVTANAAMITREGAADIEATPDEVRVLRHDDTGRLVHTNHCVHPDLVANNETHAGAIYGQSFDRKARAERILADGTQKTSIDDVKAILSDHDGYPTSICRHPNDDPSTGWQRSVVSIILEPDAGRMHVSRGNPCEAPYEVYGAGG
jgi:isopenicillin-N N-acyltransferase-like protein